MDPYDAVSQLAYETFALHTNGRTTPFALLDSKTKEAWRKVVSTVAAALPDPIIGDCTFTDEELEEIRQEMIEDGELAVRVDNVLIGGVRRDDGTTEAYTRETRDADIAKLRADGVEAVAFP